MGGNPLMHIPGTMRQRLPAVALVQATAVLVYLVALSPHLVHHAFETEAIQDECAYLTAGTTVIPLHAEVAVPALPLPTRGRFAAADPLTSGAVASPGPLTRAPPSRGCSPIATPDA